MPCFALPVFGSAATFPLVAVAYYVGYIVCNFISVYIFFSLMLYKVLKKIAEYVYCM